MYPTWLDVTTTHDLRQEVSPGNFHSQKISNGLVFFADIREGHSPNEKFAINGVTLYIFGFAVHWSFKNKPASAYNSIESNVHTLHLATKMVQCIQPILHNLGFQVLDAPTPLYEDS